jgi:hypothetical protein
VDGDVFSKVARPGRAAADAVMRALDGGVFDPFCAALCLDKLIAAAEGVPSLPGVLREVRTPDALPLFAGVLRENTGQRIASAVANAKGGILDLILKSEAQKCVHRGVRDEREMLTRFCATLLDRAIISGRNGLREKHGCERVPDVHTLLRPVAAAAAEVLLRRPDAKRLGLARRHARITPETDLLGGFA